MKEETRAALFEVLNMAIATTRQADGLRTKGFGLQANQVIERARGLAAAVETIATRLQFPDLAIEAGRFA